MDRVKIYSKYDLTTNMNINNIIDIISMDAKTGMENGGKNVFVQTITSI